MTQTDCSGMKVRWIQRAYRAGAVVCLWAMPFVASDAQDAGYNGFSRPRLAPVTESAPVETVAAKPQAASASSNLIAEIRFDGLEQDSARELAANLRCRIGTAPSRQLLADDLDSLIATRRFAFVRHHWRQSNAGWVLVFEVAPAREPVIRGQSDEFPEAGHSSPRPARPLPAPTLPRAPEDLEPSETSATPVSLEEPLAEVRVEGNVTIAVSEIERHIKTRPGRSATQTMIRDDVDELTRTRWFVSVEPVISRTDAGLVLTYRVLERPIVRHVEYRGLVKMKLKKLEGLTNLKVGSPYDVSANVLCAQRIEELYHEKGFAFATVSLEKGGSPDDREVIFVIDEGPKVKVVAVEFEGNSFFSDALLDLKLQTKKRILWAFGGKYDPATIPNDQASVTKYYRGLGFFDMGISHELKFSDDRSQVTIVYNITEGPRYKIRQIEYMGMDVIPEEELRRDQTVQSGDFFTERKIAADVEKMREKYGTLGRLFARVDAVPRYSEEPGVVDILYKIDEDQVYRVRQVNVHIAGDHPHTRTNLVRNISLIQPGDLADPKKIQRTKVRLAGSGYFENAADQAPRLDIKRVEDPGWLQISTPQLARGQDSSVMPPALAPLSQMASADPAADSRAAATSFPGMGFTSVGTATGAGAGKVTSSERGRPVPSTTGVTSTVAKPPRPTPRDDLSDPLKPLVPSTLKAPAPQRPAVEEPSPESADAIIRGQGDALLAQSRGPLQEPQNFLWDNNPQGNPLNEAIRDPDPNLWQDLPPPQFIDIDAYLAEARTGRLMFGVGVNSDAGVVGNIVLSENNFDIMRPPTSWEDIWNGTAWRGAGQKFRIEALPGSEVSRYLVDWQDPYFLDTDLNLGVSGFYYTRFFNYWDEERVGGRVRLGKQFTQTWSAAVALRLEQVKISDAYQPAPDSLEEVIGDNFLSTVRLSLAHDTRDAAFLPSTGHFVEFAVEQAFAEFNYSRLEVEGRQYFTTYQRPDGGGKHIVNLHGNFGWTSSGTPIFEKFYAGGFQSFRGFAFRGVTPRENGVDVGGEFMLLGSVEYQVPVLANEMVKVVAFSDFGTVEEDVQFDNFRVSVGGGLRIQVPGMGPVPIALDWAVPVLKADFDREQLFSFYIGINR